MSPIEIWTKFLTEFPLLDGPVLEEVLNDQPAWWVFGPAGVAIMIEETGPRENGAQFCLSAYHDPSDKIATAIVRPHPVAAVEFRRFPSLDVVRCDGFFPFLTRQIEETFADRLFEPRRTF